MGMRNESNCACKCPMEFMGYLCTDNFPCVMTKDYGCTNNGTKYKIDDVNCKCNCT